MNKFEIKTLLNKENPIIFEIGANDGSDTSDFLSTFSKCTIHCFEPDKRAIVRFKNKPELSNPRCFFNEIAIGNIDGTIDFHESSGTAGGGFSNYGDWDKSGSIKKPKNHLIQNPWCHFDNTVKINVMKLDSYVKENKIDFIDFIWADVQGAEEDLILGGLNTLNEKVKYLFTEVDFDEAYENAITLEKIQELLPNFEVVKKMEYDVLLINKKFKL